MRGEGERRGSELRWKEVGFKEEKRKGNKNGSSTGSVGKWFSLASQAH